MIGARGEADRLPGLGRLARAACRRSRGRRRNCSGSADSEEMSASRGTLTSSSVSSVSRLAIIRGRAAFLAPEIGIEPLRGAPPRDANAVHPGPSSRLSGSACLRLLQVIVSEASPSALPPRGIRGSRHPARPSGGLPAARLRFAPPEVVAQRRLEALGAVFRISCVTWFTRPIVAGGHTSFAMAAQPRI